MELPKLQEKVNMLVQTEAMKKIIQMPSDRRQELIELLAKKLALKISNNRNV